MHKTFWMEGLSYLQWAHKYLFTLATYTIVLLQFLLVSLSALWVYKIHAKSQSKVHIMARVWKNWNPSALLVGTWNDATTGKITWQFLKNLKVDLPYDPTIPFLSIYTKEFSARSRRNICTLKFLLFAIIKRLKQSKCTTMNE